MKVLSHPEFSSLLQKQTNPIVMYNVLVHMYMYTVIQTLMTPLAHIKQIKQTDNSF